MKFRIRGECRLTARPDASANTGRRPDNGFGSAFLRTSGAIVVSALAVSAVLGTFAPCIWPSSERHRTMHAISLSFSEDGTCPLPWNRGQAPGSGLNPAIFRIGPAGCAKSCFPLCGTTAQISDFDTVTWKDILLLAHTVESDGGKCELVVPSGTGPAGDSFNVPVKLWRGSATSPQSTRPVGSFSLYLSNDSGLIPEKDMRSANGRIGSDFFESIPPERRVHLIVYAETSGKTLQKALSLLHDYKLTNILFTTE